MVGQSTNPSGGGLKAACTPVEEKPMVMVGYHVPVKVIGDRCFGMLLIFLLPVDIDIPIRFVGRCYTFRLLGCTIV